MRVAPKIVLSSDEIRMLEKLARGRQTPVRLAQRSSIVLLAAEGKENQEIASRLRISRETVGRWRRRYAESGLAGIEKDAPRPGRTPSISTAKVREIVRKTTRSKPKGGKAGSHWSSRTMAAAAGVSASTVRRVWKRHGLKPHLVRTFKVSNDPRFVEKLEDIVGLYMNPPEHALVLSEQVMPLSHSENLCDQDRAVRLIKERLPQSEGGLLLHARTRRDIIRQFGRFPYRNEVLSRRETGAEAAFTQNGGYGALLRELQQEVA